MSGRQESGPSKIMDAGESLKQLGDRLVREDLVLLAKGLGEVLEWLGTQRSDGDRDGALALVENLLMGQLRSVRMLRQGVRVPAANLTGGRMSQTKLVEALLRDAGRPLHLRDIIDAIWERHGIRCLPETIASALLKRIRAGDPIARVGPNTFQHTGSAAGVAELTIPHQEELKHKGEQQA